MLNTLVESARHTAHRQREPCCRPQRLADDTLGFGSCGSQWSAVTFQRFYLVTTKILTLTQRQAVSGYRGSEGELK